VPVESVTGPVNPFRLDMEAVAVPVEPEANEILVGTTLKPKS